MRVRLFELRLLAVALTGLWTIAAGLVLLGYRPGGPIDLLVGVAATTPIAISLTAVVWPPAVRGARAFAGIMWLGLGAALLLVPSIGGIFGQLVGRGPQTLMPSMEAAYPWIAALVATSLFAGLGIARAILGQTSMRRRRLEVGVVVGVGFAALSGSIFAGAAIANELALRNLPATASRFGPTGGDLEPPTCGAAIPAPTSADIDVELSGDVDGHSIGTVDETGVRSGFDVRWLANVATSQTVGQFGLAVVDGRTWTKQPRADWQAGAGVPIGGPQLDVQVLDTLLTPGNRVASEEHGIEFVEGARARHCRIGVDGAEFLAAFPEVQWMGAPIDLHRWRGEVDYWLFLDGEVGQVTGEISGEAQGLGKTGLQATLQVTMTMTDRDTGQTVQAPIP
jgi:hypothetical protein